MNHITGLVHQGFGCAVGSIINGVVSQVQALLAQAPGTPVYVTGHSKGGGMAPIGACLLAFNHTPVAGIVTFAAPKSGDGTFATAYETLFPNKHVRYENYGDIIPFLCPPDNAITTLQKILNHCGSLGKDLASLLNHAAKWDYVPVGTEYYITSSDNDYTIIEGTTPFSKFEIGIDQPAGLALNLLENVEDIGTALGNAHTLQCGSGYMNAVCPGVCATPETAAPRQEGPR